MQTPVYLRADEHMQLNPLCLVLMDEHTEDGQVGILVRIPTLIKKNLTTFSTGVAHIPIHFDSSEKTLKQELHFIPELLMPVNEATDFIHFASKNPQVIRSIEEKLYSLQKKKEIDRSVYEIFKGYKELLNATKVSFFSLSTMATGLYFVEQNQQIIDNIGRFQLTERGGFFTFNTTVTTLYNMVAQTIVVNCKMYLFLDQSKLGYYFEFFLNHQSLLHKRIYEELPDLLINNPIFLEHTLTVLESSSNQQPSVVELIERFRESF